MSKEKLTMDEAYTCPRCGGQHVNVGAMEQIFSDARSEEISCMKCNSSWIVYYKMSDFNTKLLNITDTPLEDSVSIGADRDFVESLSVVQADGSVELASENKTKQEMTVENNR